MSQSAAFTPFVRAVTPIVRTAKLLPSMRERVNGRTVTIAWIAALVLLLLVLAKDLFTGLGFYDVYDFDEARHAVSAYEMLQRGDLLVNTYRGAADYWNLKPPLSFWAIGASFEAFGYTPFALRLPSALATIATVGLATLVSWKWYGRIAAVVTAAAAVSCLILVGAHTGRTGDPDAIFILFMTGSVLAAIESRRRPWLLVASTAMFSAAFLTKSFHAVLALVFIGVLLLVRRGSAVGGRHLLVALLGFLPLVVWAAARWAYDGGTFLTQMVTYDLLSRGSTAIEGHSQPRAYYIDLLQGTFGPWLVVLTASVVLVLAVGQRSALAQVLTQPSWRTQILLGLAIWTALVFAAFTAASTKLPWYVASGMPTLCMGIGAVTATALRQRRRAASAVIVLLLIWAALSGQSLLRAVRTAEVPVATQLALAGLDRAPGLARADAFLDPSVSADGTSSSWPQSLTAVAEMSGDLVPNDDGPQAFLRTGAEQAVLLTKSSSRSAVSALRAGARIVSRSGDVVVITRH